MSNNIDENKRVELHVKNRNKILLELQHVYEKHLYSYSSELGNFRRNLSERYEKLYSSIIEDLLIEMSERKRAKEFDESNNTDCYRCRHFLNVPQHLSPTREKVSNFTEEYLADLNFVQSIVWLKSCTMSMKNISAEQLHFVFHKQWDSNVHKDTSINYSLSNRESFSEMQENNRVNLNSEVVSESSQGRNMNFSGGSEYSNSIYLLDTQHYEKVCISQPDRERQINRGNEICIEKKSNPCVFASYQSLERFFNTQSCTQRNAHLSNRIISDSNEEYSSSSDMFRDSQESQEVSNIMQNEKDHRVVEKSNRISQKSAKEFSSTSRSSGVLKRIFSETRDEKEFSDITSSSKDCALRKTCSQILTQLTSESYERVATPLSRIYDSSFRNKNSIIFSSQINDTASPQKDSAYDTYELSVECNLTTNCIQLQNEDIFSRQKVDSITLCQENKNLNDEDDLEFLTKDLIEEGCISYKNRQFSSSQHKSSGSTNPITQCGSVEKSRISDINSQNRCSQIYKNSIEDTEYGESSSKKSKLNYAHKSSTSSPSKKKQRNISSRWLRFTLDALNVDDVALQSVKLILSVLQNEDMTKQYMKRRCWKDTLEEQAINAVLNFCDVSGPKDKTNACIQEIVQVVTSILDKSIETVELNKVTISIHQISIVLQLCASIQVCVETINYLIGKLKSYENILVSLMNTKKANVHNIINQLHIIFYALTFCLQKYRLIFPIKKKDQFEEEIIPPVVDLWKKQLNFEGVIPEESIETREQRWLIILDDFTVMATENFVQFARKSRKLVNLLTRE